MADLPHRYWRLEINSWMRHNINYNGISGIVFRDGNGSNLNSYVTLTSDKPVQAGSFASVLAAYTGTNHLQWETYNHNTSDVNLYVDFGAGNAFWVNSIDIYPNKDNAPASPRYMRWYYSDDGATWVHVAVLDVTSTYTWTIGTVKSFVIPAEKSNYLWWGVGDFVSPVYSGSAVNTSIGEVRAKTSGGTNLFSGTGSATTIYAEDAAAIYAFDGDYTTEWAGAQDWNDKFQAVVGSLSTAGRPVTIEVQSRNDTRWWRQTPYQLTILAGDDPTALRAIKRISPASSPYTGANETVSYIVGSTDISAEVSFKWQVVTDPVTATLYAKWNVASSLITADIVTKWNVAAADISTQLTARWNVETIPVHGEMTAVWDVTAAPITQTLTASWDVGLWVSRALVGKWNVAGVPLPVSRSLGVRWNVTKADGSVTYVVRDVTFTWDDDGAFVAASRTIYPDMPITEVWSYSTSVFRSLSGVEQRRSLRENPIIIQQFDALGIMAEDFRTLRNAVELDVTAFYPVPLFQYGEWLTLPTVTGEDRLYFDTSEMLPVVGGLIAVCNDDTLNTIYGEIVEVFANGVRVSPPLSADVDPRVNYVAPVRLGRVSTNSSSQLSAMHARAKYAFISVDRYQSFLPEDHGVTLPYVDDVLLLDKFINADTALTETYLSGVANIDNEKAVPVLFVDEPTRREIDLSFMVNRISAPLDIVWWKAFAQAVGGSWKTFALPTYRSDATVYGVHSVGDTVLRLENDDAYEAFTTGGYVGVMYNTPSGREYRKVVSVTLIDSVSVCTLSEPIGDASFNEVSFLMRMRVSDDKFILTHYDTRRQIKFKAVMAR